MKRTLHITSGDMAGDFIWKTGIPGDVLVWHDVLYDGPRKPGWPDSMTLRSRAQFLENLTAGGLKKASIFSTLEHQYQKLAAAVDAHIVLWFDACLFDQSMLAHILACMFQQGIVNADLLCIDAFPGIAPYHGIGQLSPSQLASVYDRRQPVTDLQFQFAGIVDKAFADQDMKLFADFSRSADVPLPWVPAAMARWLQERPDPVSGLGKLETLALDAIRDGNESPAELFKAVAAAETPPQYWGDITLWAKINALADRSPPLVRIEGPAKRLPQWEGGADLKKFRITIV